MAKLSNEVMKTEFEGLRVFLNSLEFGIVKKKETKKVPQAGIPEADIDSAIDAMELNLLEKNHALDDNKKEAIKKTLLKTGKAKVSVTTEVEVPVEKLKLSEVQTLRLKSYLISLGLLNAVSQKTEKNKYGKGFILEEKDNVLVVNPVPLATFLMAKRQEFLLINAVVSLVKNGIEVTKESVVSESGLPFEVVDKEFKKLLAKAK